VVPADGFLPRLREWTAANGIVMIADEIQTGFCRTGDWFACDHEDVVPDLVTTAKGMAGGLPLAAVTGRAEIMDAVHVGGLGGTYGGNPVACSAALGAIEAMRTHDLCGAARRLGEVMRERLAAVKEAHTCVGDIRGRGAMTAVEIVGTDGHTPEPVRAGSISSFCHSQGVLTLTCGTYGNVLRFLPPLVMPEALLHDAFDVVAAAFDATA
jgi:4-aminobutyrate aminotransferase/(S)-3-amino-2-methylpropionate transaminase